MFSERIMPKFKARAVATPGSKPKVKSKSKGRGRPKKEASKAGFSRKGNYRSSYTQEKIDLAMEEVRSHAMSLGEASKEFGVPKTTIHDRLKNVYGEKLGWPWILTELEEAIIVQRVKVMATWGFPLATQRLQDLVKDYLVRLGRTTRKVKSFV